MNLTRPSTLALLAAATAYVGGTSAQAQISNDFETAIGSIFSADTVGSGSDIGQAAPDLFIVDDSAGIGSGNALFVESRGSGREVAAFFDAGFDGVTIGPNIGDGVAIQLDWRLIIPDDVPAFLGNGLGGGVDFRFGFLNDGDGDIGQQFGEIVTDTGEIERDDLGEPVLDVDGNTIPILETGPAILGQTAGEFDNSGGPIADDSGVHTRVFFNAPISEFRIRDEPSSDAEGIFSGNGNTIATGNSAVPGVEGEDPQLAYEAIGNGDVSNLLFEVFRGERDILQLDGEGNAVLDEDGNEIVLGTEETINGRFTVTNDVGTVIIENDDPLSQQEVLDFNYILFENNSGDFDYIIDNLEVFEFSDDVLVDALIGDFSSDQFVAQADLDLVLLNFGSEELPENFNAANTTVGEFDGLISQNELDDVLLNFGDSAAASAVSAVPEPTTAALLGLAGVSLLARRRRA